MKVRCFFGQLRAPEQWTRMRAEIKRGDLITYVDRGLYGSRYDVKVDKVSMVADRWIFPATEDEAVPWDNILDWEPAP